MATTGTPNVYFIICTTSSDTILKISYKVPLAMENQNLKFIFNNKSKASRILTLFQTGSNSILPTIIVVTCIHVPVTVHMSGQCRISYV